MVFWEPADVVHVMRFVKFGLTGETLQSADSGFVSNHVDDVVASTFLIRIQNMN
jgi:hypothetical protein